MCRAYDIHFYPTFRVSAAPPPAARTAWGLGEGVSQLRGFCVQGSPLIAPRWIAGSHWDCALAGLTPSEACRHGSGRRCPESACPSEAGPAGALPRGGGLVPASCASSRGRPADQPVPISPARGRLEPEQCTQLCVCVCAPVCACTRVPVCVAPRLTGAHLRREAVPLEVASGKLGGPLPLSPEPAPCVHSASCFSPSC